MFHPVITKVYATDYLSLITVANLPAKTKIISALLRRLGDEDVTLDMINQTPPYNHTISLSFAISDDDLGAVIALLGGLQKEIPGIRTDVNSGNSKILLRGEGMHTAPGVAAAAFSTLADAEIEVKTVTTSDVDITLLVDMKDAERALEALKA